ncbi:MAG: hypothetical protein ACI9GW_001178 [Halieaceae bacterium]
MQYESAMIKNILLGSVLLIFSLFALFHLTGKGVFGGPWESHPVVTGPRPAVTAATDLDSDQNESQILFGDLHVHTNHSMDAYFFSSALIKGGGVVTPADACDFARYCSALDFWSINDHAEGLTPRAWGDTVSAIRNCNAQAGDQANPDMVSFLGWEWSNGNKRDVPNHYGHKNVIFRTWEAGQTPSRPIAARKQSGFPKGPPLAFGMMSLTEGIADASDLGWYIEESKSTPICAENIPSDQLPDDCREIALTPKALYRKLDEWGLDSMVIPHGLAWGNTNPLAGDFRDQLDEHEQRYQKLLEVYSGHGSSELFENFQRLAATDNGRPFCPESTENFTPCCRQAGIIVRQRCANPANEACEQQVVEAIDKFVKRGTPGGRKTLADTTLDDWAGCGQLRNTFQPSAMYVPRLSAQYSLALGFDERGEPKRAKFGLIGSSDGHQARPGSSYKESNRLLYTDHKDVGREYLRADLLKADKESGAFYYTGGLIALHADGRDRDAIWQALSYRNVYATSGDRMLVWFDLVNGPTGKVPMGSEVAMNQTPHFKVRALGAFEQKPGCPDYSTAALGEERLQSLCGGECYYPGGDTRKAISRIEVVRIRPQITPGENIEPLVENNWRSFDCPADGHGCEVEFDDPEYAVGGRAALYYARVIQEAEPLIGGDPFSCEYDNNGVCVKRNYCIGENAKAGMNCLSEAEPRAWSSPIFIEQP